MVNNETFLPLKLICQKINLKKILFCGIALFLGFVFLSLITKNCGVEYLAILGEIQSLENSFDPESCEYVVERIDVFNDQCQSQIEILDCG